MRKPDLSKTPIQNIVGFVILGAVACFIILGVAGTLLLDDSSSNAGSSNTAAATAPQLTHTGECTRTDEDYCVEVLQTVEERMVRYGQLIVGGGECVDVEEAILLMVLNESDLADLNRAGTIKQDAFKIEYDNQQLLLDRANQTKVDSYCPA